MSDKQETTPKCSDTDRSEKQWKSLRSQLRKRTFERDQYKKAAEEWMAEYDRLKEKYEPSEAVLSSCDVSLTTVLESPDAAKTQENPEITKERNRLFVRKVDELNEALRLKDERIAEFEAENKDLRHEMRMQTSAVQEKKDLEAKLKLATDALENLVNSEVVKSAEFITYSEAYSNARETLAKLKPTTNKGE